jgi:hypothetical protein
MNNLAQVHARPSDSPVESRDSLWSSASGATQNGGQGLAHAMHEDSFVIYCKTRYFIPKQRATMASFRLDRDDFSRLSIEILSDCTLGRPANAAPGFAFPRLSSLCYALVQGDSLPVISLNHCVSKSSQATDINHFHASNTGAARPALPC